MSVPREKIEAALEAARADQNDEAVAELEKRLSQMPEPAAPEAPVEQPSYRTPTALERFAYSPAGGVGMPMNVAGGPALIDKETGVPAGNTPEEMQGALQTAKAAGGTLVAGTLDRLVGNPLANVDEGIERGNAFQRVLFSKLPEEEQSRVRSRLSEKYGRDVSDLDVGRIPASTLREILDENPDNENLLDQAAGKEWREERKQFWRRLGANMFLGQSGMANIGGGGPALQQAMQDARSEAQQIARTKGYDQLEYAEGEAPWYPGASEDARAWESEAERDGPGVYEHLIKPVLTSKEGVAPGMRVKDVAESIIKKTYSDEQLANRELPFISKDVEINSPLDLFDARIWTDPNTKMPHQNFEAFMLEFLYSVPEMGASILAARGGGRMAAKSVVRDNMGRTSLANLDKMRMRAAGRGGVLAGSAVEGYTVSQGVQQETTQTLKEVPLEKYRTVPQFQQLVAAGMTEEEARQLMANEAGGLAGQVALVGTVALGGPMSYVFGQSGAGALARRQNMATRMGLNALGEGTTEGAQEMWEMYAGDMQVEKIDPDNPMFKEPNRYANAFAGGFAFGSLMGASGGIDAETPAGFNESEKEVAKATAKFMQATNDRMKFQTKVTSPEYINATAPVKRLEAMERLEKMQLEEAEALIEAEPKMRKHLEEQGTLTAQTELKMLDRLKMRANAMKADIAMARQKRTTATRLQDEEQRIIQERAELQRRVEEQVTNLEDLESMSQAIEIVQEQGELTQEQEADLLREGYAKRVGDEQRLIVTPKGRRGVKEMRRQARQLRKTLEAGYTGEERRQTTNVTRRQLIDEMSDADREQALYTDDATGVQNRRAFNERQEHIDVKAGESKRNVEGAAPVVAAIDVDSLKWVNDNMSHAAGDRMLVAVADALNAQPGVEVFRLGGDEFAVTGASNEEVEAALQAAAQQLQTTPIVAENDEVIPTITWGKGATYDEADAESINRKGERQRRGQTGTRGGKPAGYRVRSQGGLFQLDEGETRLPSHWGQIRDQVERGHVVEILSPDGASFGTVLSVKRGRGRPRIMVSVDGRVFRFNPDRNWLIVDEFQNPMDLAYITGDQDYADPDRETFPQTLSDVMIGHVGDANGNWYADLAQDIDYDAPLPWYEDRDWEPRQLEFIPYEPPRATAEEVARAEAVIAQMTDGMSNLPPINIVKSIADIERDSPDVAAQIRAELGGGQMTGVRGYMDHINPQNGVYIFLSNIRRLEGDTYFEQGIVETVAHEVIGHYGVRGFFGNEATLRGYMNELVDAFPVLANHMASRLGLSKADPDQKQLLGEEMVAYIAGEVESGKVRFSDEQKSLWQKIISWIKNWLTTHGFDRYAPLKKFVRRDINSTKEEFWNDQRVQDLLMHSRDFVRNGPEFSWAAIGGSHRFMRDADMFKAGVLTAIDSAIETIPKSQRKNMAQQSGVDINEIPKERPLFPDSASPNAYKQAIVKAQKENYFSNLEAKLSGLASESDWNFFEEATYGHLLSLHSQFVNPKGINDTYWYRGIVPPAIEQELDAIYAKMQDHYMAGPLGPGMDENRRPVTNQAAVEAMHARISEIMSMKMDQKKTMLTKDLLRAHLRSNESFRVEVHPQGGFYGINNTDAMRRLFGDDVGVDDLTPEMEEMVKNEVERSKSRGYDIGYDKQQDRWFDWTYDRAEYAGYSPAGTRHNSDYRVALIKTFGRDAEMTNSGQHYDPNIMHIRTGESQLLQYEGAPEITSPNPAKQGLALAMIELQSDHFQKLRKGFGSPDEKEAAKNEVAATYDMLIAQSRKFSESLSLDIQNAIEQKLKPILNLPDTSESTTRGSLFAKIQEKVQEQFAVAEGNVLWEDLTADQQRAIWKEVRDEQVNLIRADVTDLYAKMIKYRDEEIIPKRQIGGSLDARGFQRLDLHTAERYVNGVINALDDIQSFLTYVKMADSQREMLDTYNRRLARSVQAVHNAGQSGVENTRLPMVDYLIRPMLEQVYNDLGADVQSLDLLLESTKKQHMATARIPKQVIADLITAQAMVEGQVDPRITVQDIFSNAIQLDVGLVPSRTSISVRDAGEFFDLNISGDKGAIQQFSEKMPEMIRKWVEVNGQQTRDNQLQHNLNRARSSASNGRQDGYSYSELVDYLSLEEEDTSGESNAHLSNNDVTTYYEFEENVRDEIETEILESTFQNYDWSNTDWTRDSEEYRERLIIDDDGDVDNSDAEQWLEEGREAYKWEEMREEIMDDVYNEVYERWTNQGPTALITGQLPYAWDDEGNVDDSVSIMIIAKEPGDAYDIYIDGEEVDYAYDLDEAKNKLDEAISEWYDDVDYEPPTGEPYSLLQNDETEEALAAQAAIDAPKPNWDMVAGNIAESASMISDGDIDLQKKFEEMVTLSKRTSGPIMPNNPLAKDEIWRPIALKYLLMDAVRRGYGAVVWNNGLASSQRGGMGLSGAKKTKRIAWSKQKMVIRDQEQEVYVITSPELGTPIVVSPDKMVPVLGLDVVRHISAQERGKIPAMPDVQALPVDGKVADLPPLEDNYLFSTTADGRATAIYRREDQHFIGIATDDAMRDALVQQDIEAMRRARERAVENEGRVGGDPESVPLLGTEALSSGVVRQEDVGDALYVITGSDNYGYEHTFEVPRLAGARQSYEEMTMRIWNKELKKYGARIEETYIQIPNQNQAYNEEGQPARITDNRAERIDEDHGVIEVQELRGDVAGWVVISQKRGVIDNNVFSSRRRAANFMQDYIDTNYGIEKEGVKTYVIRINDKIRDEFSGPVAPFHYDPEQDPALDNIRQNVGRKHSKKSWRQRYAEFKFAARHTVIQGAFDKFYGLKRALLQTGNTDDSYIDARLSTSLDSMLRAAVEFGYPVWRDGVVANEGKGLGEIMSPIMTDPDTWGYFMAGRRGKRLMMEGYDSLAAEGGDRFDRLRRVRELFDGENDREKVWNMLIAYDRGEIDPVSFSVVRPSSFTDADLSGLSQKEKDYLEYILGTEHWRKPQSGNKKNRYVDRTYGERYRIYDWRQDSNTGTARVLGRDTVQRKWEKQIADMQRDFGFTSEAEARASLDKLTELALKKQTQMDTRMNDVGLTKKTLNDIIENTYNQMVERGREKTFKPAAMEAAIRLGDKFPHFQRVADDYAEFNSKLLDFAEEAGMIDADSRKVWEHADYVPFYRIEDDRLVGSFAPSLGISNQKSPIKRLRGKEDAGIGDVVNNIFINVTKLIDGAVKNNAARNAVDALNGTGMLKKVGMATSQQMIPKTEMKKVLKDFGIDPKNVPKEAFEGIQKMMAIEPPSGEGYISIMRNGKREYYFTDDVLLYRSLSAINLKKFGNWIKFFRGPKRLLTEWITLDPAFTVANMIRDTGSAFVVGRDFVPPIIGAVDGFGRALAESEEIRTMLSAGAAFENGYTTGGDPDATRRLLRRYTKEKNFANTVLDSPAKLYRAWRHVTTASENANRIAVYKAALAAGKSKKRALYEAKDLMDFSMSGDWPVIQFLIQSVPFMNARLQGNYRLGRGAIENPVGFTMRGLILGMAGWMLYMGFRDDERYQQLEMWDKHAYFHWWIGDEHYRLPKPFEVGAIFNTIPEMFTEAYLSDAPDAETDLMKGFAHMFSETFSMNPIPQTAQPIVESLFNYNFFTGRPIVSFFEQQRLPPEQYRYRTSPTMRELGRALPKGLDTHYGKVRSPLHLENLYYGYTGTIGRYLLMASDSMVRAHKDYPLPPAFEDQDWPVWGRFIRGDSPPRRTKQETKVYELLNRVNAVQGSMSFALKTGDTDRYRELITDEAEFIAIARPLENIRRQVSNVNSAIMQIYLDKEMDPQEKTKQINLLEESRNKIFDAGYKLRPGGENNPMVPTAEDVIGLIDEFNMEGLEQAAPATAQLIGQITAQLDYRSLASLAKAGGEE